MNQTTTTNTTSVQDTTPIKIREDRVRRRAAAQGLRLAKSRSRTPRDPSYSGYMLVDAARNFVVLGGHPWAYSADLEDVEAYLSEEQ
jgi:hypothetical protein